MLWIKAFHIVFVVFWFAGLLYLPRLFVYHAMEADEGRRFALMERRLFRIMTVGAVGALSLGIWLMVAWWDAYRTAGWLHAKLLLVVALIVYHIACGRYVRRFAAGTNHRSSVFYRYFNEIPAFLLIAIAILAVVKPF